MGDELWAWQVEEQPDVWSLVGMVIPGDPPMHTALIHRSREVIEQFMRPLAERHAAETGQKLRLAHFKLAEVITP